MSLNSNDPHYIKEKVSALWVAVAKRVWGFLETESQTFKDFASSDRWIDMDSSLVQLWATNNSTRELTLSIFRTLFEDVFMLDDPVAANRSTILNAQCMEILTSVEDLGVEYESRVESLQKLREGSEGWLNRWSVLLGACLDNGLQNAESENFALKILETLKTCLYWALPISIRNANLLERLSIALTLSNIAVKTLAVDCLHILFTRTFSNNEDFQAVVGAVFLTSGMNTLTEVYDSIVVNLDDFDDKSYILVKKLAEMIVGLGEYLNLSKTKLPDDADLSAYLRLVLKVTTNPSLVVSGYTLQFWCSVLRVDNLTEKQEVIKLLPDLLRVAAERCLKYEDVSEDHESRRFLEMDFDSTPESQTFLGNYRKYIEDIVRLVVCQIPIDSINWLKGRMNEFFSSETGWHSLNTGNLKYEGNPSYFLAYSQLILVESALHGVTRWRIWYKLSDKEELDSRITMTVEDWGSQLLNMSFQNPVLLRKLVQSLVQFAPVLKKSSNLIFSILEKVITTCTTEYPANGSDYECELVRDLRTSCGTELNRLAYMIPEALMRIYGDLERVIGEIISSDRLSDHEAVAFRSFLLVVSQRSNIENKAERFAAIVDPVLQSWSDEGTMKGLMELPWFMERVGIVKIAEYFRSRGVTADTDLLKAEMDDAGRALKVDLKKTWAALFPIRATRVFIQYTIEKLDHSSQEFQDLLNLWKPRVQPITPHILQLIAQIEAYHNPNNWADLPLEVQSFVKYSCMERFWQVGVSTQTKDEFVDENVRAMHTLRDFADSVGHIIRYTREYAFLTLGSISQLEETLYEMPGIATHLWTALAGDSTGITSHSWRHMISLVLRNVVNSCPVHLIKPFITEFLPPMLTKLDEVLTEKWNKVYATGVQLVGGEDDESLSEEMMEEHLLRQLTAIVDRLLIDMVGQLGSKSNADAENEGGRGTILRETIVRSKDILAPLLTLVTHIMAFKDIRCSFNSCLVLRNILPQILLQDSEVDIFLCDNVTKTCLDILNDPYFTEVHNEAGYILTTVYTVLRSQHQRPFETLSRLLPNVSIQSLADFETRLANPKSLRQQRGVFLEFLALVKAMHTNDNESARELLRKRAQVSEKRRDKNKWLTKKASQGGNLMEEDVLEDNAISNLFGNN